MSATSRSSREGRGAGAGPGAEGTAGTRSQRRTIRRADSKVREAVRRYGGCLDVLTRRQKRVLRLRAGVGPAEPATQVEVARRLDLSVRRVRRAERKGVRTLERAGSRGCEAAAPSAIEQQAFAVGGALGAVLVGGSVPDPSGAGGSELAAVQDGQPRDGATGATGSTGYTGGEANGDDGQSGGVKGITATRPAPEQAGTDLALPILVICLLSIFGAALWRARRWLDEQNTSA